MLIVLDENNIIIDMASEEGGLSKAKKYLGYPVHEVPDTGFMAGDEYDLKAGAFTTRPENHPVPSTEERTEDQIQVEMRRLAVDSLKTRGELPPDFIDARAAEIVEDTRRET